jgi:excisionase family DNA binding protein
MFLTVDDIMDYFKCGRNKAYEIINIDGFPRMQMGRRYLVYRPEFDKWVAANYNKKILL